MMEKLRFIAKCIKEFAKSNKITCICFLLAISVAFTGAASFAKYVSGDPINNNPNAALFNCNASVDDVSALSFTNMAFWGGLEEIGVSMNSLRHVSISVNNYETVGDKQMTTEVPAEYALIFELPQNFASKLAIQLSGEGDKILTPQMELASLIGSVSESKTTAVYETTNPKFNGKDYSGVNSSGNVVSFITFDVKYDTVSGAITATSRDRDGTVIKIEPFIKENMEQTLYFRLWDVESRGQETVELEGGTLLTPLALTFNEDVPFYRITLERPDFRFKAGATETDEYSLSLAPTDALRDTHLGGYLMDETDGEFVYARVIEEGREIYLSTVTEVIHSEDGSDDQITLMGNIPTYIIGNVYTNDLGKSYRETSHHDIYSTTQTTTTNYTDDDHTRYYTYNRWRRTWTQVGEGSGLYKIENWLHTTTTTTTYYEVHVREITSVTEDAEVTSISGDKTKVQQTVTKESNTENVIIDIFKRDVITVSYSESYKMYQRDGTGDSWENEVTSFKYNGSNVSFTGAYPPSYEKEDPPVQEPPAVVLSGDEITALCADPDFQAALEANGIKDKTSTTVFERTITYTAGNQVIKPTSLYTADTSIPLAPLNTHIVKDGATIQKYYISTSYSKNYPFFVKVHFEQLAE